MKVLVIGSGGREHALAWKLAQSPRVEEVIVAPGNAGTAREKHLRNAAVAVNDIDGLLVLARAEGVELTIVGPEVPLVAGLVDAFGAAGLRCFGPSAKAAQLEGSKAYAKAFLERNSIPTAHYAVHTELEPALAYVRGRGAPIVIKADGLAAGKGVVVAMTLAEAEAALHDMLGEKVFGDASSSVVIEEFLEGEEASFIVMSDGRHALPMASSQDHKRRDDGDEGPNTGGMGAYSPAPVVTQAVQDRVMREVIEPTLRGMEADGATFVGFLYAGLMIDAQGAPKVIEFNVRFGDPETQPIMLRLKSDLVNLVDAALDGKLDQVVADWDERPSIGVVLAADGYPGQVHSGDVISGHDASFGPDVKVFHAGTGIDAQGRVITAGGRVLTVCALGDTLAHARDTAYSAIDGIAFQGRQFRQDIAHRALK
ncbi:phosphoribosylamine--glycine ligase [Pinirhizobacter sp.]|jgi:phosphoribosylamine--glycine ligase|uniref:phosphoribosylamine--glycine ligase n=1 Tax=Pinirhizobacter sp. TaxID=2950432 RepID=UPI002F4002F7